MKVMSYNTLFGGFDDSDNRRFLAQMDKSRCYRHYVMPALKTVGADLIRHTKGKGGL